jgi:hypothetical protein
MAFEAFNRGSNPCTPANERSESEVSKQTALLATWIRSPQ